MKNLLSLLIGIILLYSCQLAGINDISDLTEEQIEELIVEIETPRNVTGSDAEELFYWKAFTTVPDIIQEATVVRINNGRDSFLVKYTASECDSIPDTGLLFTYEWTGYGTITAPREVYMDMIQNTSVKQGSDGTYTVVLDFGQQMRNEIVRNYCNGEDDEFADEVNYSQENPIELYGFTEDEAEFLAERILALKD